MTTETRDGIRIVSLGIDPRPDTLYVVNAHLRSYLGLSRDGLYMHAVRPARLEDPVVGDGKFTVGSLLCSCAAGEFGRACYWTRLAEDLETGERGGVIEPIPWLEQGAHA